MKKYTTPINRLLSLLCITLAICGGAVVNGQPAISMSKDASGETRVFMAGQLNITEDIAALLYNIDNKVFTCTLVEPLKAGDVIASQFSSDQGWSMSTAPLLVGTKKVQFPILATVKSSDGRMRAILPAVLKFKIDIKAGEILHADFSNGLGFDIETKRPVKAGDSIPVLFFSGPSILSVETAGGAKTGSEAQPWLTAFQKSDNRPATIEAWRIEIEHVGK